LYLNTSSSELKLGLQLKVGLYKAHPLSHIIYELKKLKVVETKKIAKTQKTIHKEFEVHNPEIT
jgi:hypothetical protein